MRKIFIFILLLFAVFVEKAQKYLLNSPDKKLIKNFNPVISLT